MRGRMTWGLVDRPCAEIGLDLYSRHQVAVGLDHSAMPDGISFICSA